MNSEIFSRNLRRLRQEKGMTQEQLATFLGVSPQSVSRWECGNTLPDVMLLPELARLYGVTVDDFYREEIRGYPSYAQRLLAVYEVSGRSEDFQAAELEFSRMKEMSADDLRAWGVLYQYRMQQCAALSARKLEAAMAHPDVTPEVYSSAAQQRITLLCEQGKGAQVTQEYEKTVTADPSDPQQWLLLAASHYFSGNHSRAREVAEKGISRFPDYGALWVYAGDICRTLKEYENAFSFWRQALKLDSGFLDARYSMASCYEELGQYFRAVEEWSALAEILKDRGMTIEAEHPARQASLCSQKANN